MAQHAGHETLAIISATMDSITKLKTTPDRSTDVFETDSDEPTDAKIHGYVMVHVAECCILLNTAKHPMQYTLLLQVAIKLFGKAEFKAVLAEKATEASETLPTGGQEETLKQTEEQRVLNVISAALVDFPKVSVDAEAVVDAMDVHNMHFVAAQRFAMRRLALALTALRITSFDRHARLLKAVAAKIFGDAEVEHAVAEVPKARSSKGKAKGQGQAN